MNKNLNNTLTIVLGSALAVGCTNTMDNAIAAAVSAIVTVAIVALLCKALKSFITDDIKIPAVLIITACAGTVGAMVTNALFPAAYKATSMYLLSGAASLLAFAVATKSENLGDACKSVIYLAAVLVVMGFVREFIAYGKVFGNAVEFMSDYTVSIFGQVPGGLVIFGIVLAVFNKNGYRFDVNDVLEAEPVVEVETKEGE